MQQVCVKYNLKQKYNIIIIIFTIIMLIIITIICGNCSIIIIITCQIEFLNVALVVQWTISGRIWISQQELFGTPDVFVIFWRSAIAIKDHNCLLRANPQLLHITQVTVGDLLLGLLFPLHHLEKTSAINHHGVAGLVIEVKWIS